MSAVAVVGSSRILERQLVRFPFVCASIWEAQKESDVEIKEFVAKGVRFSCVVDGKEVARAYLYVLTNDLHAEPFGLLEDVYVSPDHRSSGHARALLAEVIARATVERCYKLIATSRNDGTRQDVHDWYIRLGFKDYGTEFRMNL